MSVYLNSNFAPVRDEVTAFHLPVLGTLPPELNGRYVRNGPNPIGTPDPLAHHWFLGDGMVHGVRLRDGKADWYRNRYVGSDATCSRLGRCVSGPNWSGGSLGANTNVGGFAGSTWAMVEGGGSPVELSYDLDTVGRSDFSGTLPGAFTAHPKVDPLTGEMHAVAYAPAKWFDHVQYIVVAADGRVRRTLDIPMGMSMVHDMSLTERFALIYDLPVTVDLGEAVEGRPFPLKWNPAYGARVGLLPREGEASDIVWVEVPLCYAFHPLNAYDQSDGTVVVDLCVYDRMFAEDRNGPFGDNLPRLERWVLNPATRTTSVTVIDETPQEFPRHAGRVGGRAHRFGYTTGVQADALGDTIKHDLVTGRRSAFHHGPGMGAGEAVFVPRSGASPDGPEDDGWLMMFVHSTDGRAASFVVMDAQELSRGYVAEIKLPARVPYGFHGNWISDRSVPPTD